MMRDVLLRLSHNGRAQVFVTQNAWARRAARRFIAGETLPEALAVVERLNQSGLLTTVDHLGEHVTTSAEAQAAAREYLRLLDALAERGLPSHISLKLTQMGLDIDEGLCEAHVQQIVAKAQTNNTFARIDMEGSAYTERTLRLYERLASEGWRNLGVVVQAYLYRSRGDLQRLLMWDWPANVRLCKGAYREPPAVAYPKKSDVDRNLFELSQMLLSDEARRKGVYLALATHDARIIVAVKRFMLDHGIDHRAMEFQMLYGVRRHLQEQLAREGYCVRIYVSYGRHWYPYFMRRLAERPANVLFLLRNILRA